MNISYTSNKPLRHFKNKHWRSKLPLSHNSNKSNRPGLHATHAHGTFMTNITFNNMQKILSFAWALFKNVRSKYSFNTNILSQERNVAEYSYHILSSLICYLEDDITPLSRIDSHIDCGIDEVDI